MNNLKLNNCFSSGPCKKRPGWTPEIFNKSEIFGRSHRSIIGKKLIKEVIDLQKELLNLPEDYILGIVTGSDTGAFETGLWNLLGSNAVDILNFDSFSNQWTDDVINILKIENVRNIKVDYGKMPDLTLINKDNDLVFVYNGTTSGVCFNNLDFISDNRKGLVFCDATSAAFANDINIKKIDVFTYSWQKVLGGEAGFGVIILSPRAIERLEKFEPERPIPKIYRIKKDGKCNLSIFEGATINTISLLCVEDFKDSLLWAKNNGGLNYLIEKTKENSNYLYNYIDNNKYLETLCEEKKYRSPTSVCFSIKDNCFNNLEEKKQKIKSIITEMEKNELAFDINSYKTAPIGFRLWCGPTVELNDIKNFCKNFDIIVQRECLIV